jgi:hypothetical protein
MDERQRPSPEEASGESPQSYEPPTVEDLDNSHGPSVTAAGIPSPSKAAPRDL